MSANNAPISRRRALGLGAAAVTGPLLAGCHRSGTSGKKVVEENAQVTLPTYERYHGVRPDLPGTADGVADGFFAYPARPVRATHGVPGDGQPITAMVETSAPIPPGVGQNAYWQELNRRIGSPLKLTIVPSSDFGPKFQTSVAGGSLSDMAQLFGDTRSLPQLLGAKAIDLTEHLSGDAIKDYPFLANIPTDAWRGCVFNGGIYAIPVPRGVASCSVLLRRDDLLDKMGADPTIGNFEDLFTLCQKVSDPRHNRWALASVPLDYLRMMLSIPNNWHNDGGQLTSAFESPQQKDALNAGRRLIKADLVHPDSFTTSVHETAKTWFSGGAAVMIQDTYSALPGFIQQIPPGSDTSIGYMDLPGFHGGRGHIWLANPSHNATAFAKSNAKRVKSLLSVANWLAAPFGTEEYLFRRYGRAGEHYQLKGTDPILNTKGNLQTQLGGFCIQYITDAPQALYYPGRKEVVQKEYDHQRKVIPAGVADPALGLYSDTQVRLNATLVPKMKDAANAILQGRRPISSWDDEVREWKHQGGDKIRAELEQALAYRPH